ncbi:MAG: TIGR02253 family HAD-type hydrolase [Planctomycetes bacterium]|nr:TIGR02253 family HAD-type hydrolase [Planctomycetota bacterium]
MPDLRAIFFDIDDTLYSTSEFAEQARSASIDAMIEAGLDIDREVLRQELEEVIQEFSSNFDHHFDRLLQRIPRRAYRHHNPVCIVAAGVVAYHETKARHLAPYEDASEVLKILSGTDLIRGVITAGVPVKQAEKLVRLRLIEYFTPSAIFIADQVGVSKPNPKLYRRVCSMMNLRPSETMYVGDNPLSDIDPPASIGMITVRLRRSGKYRDAAGATEPRFEIQNFWDLLDRLRKEFGIAIPA